MFNKGIPCVERTLLAAVWFSFRNYIYENYDFFQFSNEPIVESRIHLKWTSMI